MSERRDEFCAAVDAITYHAEGVGGVYVHEDVTAEALRKVANTAHALANEVDRVARTVGRSMGCGSSYAFGFNPGVWRGTVTAVCSRPAGHPGMHETVPGGRIGAENVFAWGDPPAEPPRCTAIQPRNPSHPNDAHGARCVEPAGHAGAHSGVYEGKGGRSLSLWGR